MKSSRLELDHLRKMPRPARLSWLLLAIAVVFALEAGCSYLRIRWEIESKTTQLARALSSRSSLDTAALPRARPLSREEFAAAQDTILRLSMPWDNVFRALEGARSDDVALLSIEPDAASGSVSIAGEAASYPAVLTYVAWLAHEKTLRNVRLSKHELVQGGSRRPVLFTIAADWDNR